MYFFLFLSMQNHFVFLNKRPQHSPAAPSSSSTLFKATSSSSTPPTAPRLLLPLPYHPLPYDVANQDENSQSKLLLCFLLCLLDTANPIFLDKGREQLLKTIIT
jgi:hypothetical protein